MSDGAGSFDPTRVLVAAMGVLLALLVLPPLWFLAQGSLHTTTASGEEDRDRVLRAKRAVARQDQERSMWIEKATTVNRERKALPRATRMAVWNHYVGRAYATGKCRCCKDMEIHISNFHCGHVRSVARGGHSDLANLRPICAICNLSMGTMDMRDYVIEHNYIV